MGFHGGKLALILVILQVSNHVAVGLSKYGLQDRCGSTIQVLSPWQGLSSSIILVPRLSTSYSEGSDCSVIIKSTLSSYGMVVSVRKIDLRPNNVDALTITYKTLFGNKQQTFQNYGSYPDRQIDSMEYKSYVSTSNVTINFRTYTTGRYKSLNFDGFELILTATSSTPCGYNEFRCNAGRCIGKDLTCDGHNHCGDSSDQWDCGASTGAIVGSVFGCIFLVVAIVCCIIFVKRRNRSGVTTTITTRPGIVPPPVYVPNPGNVQTGYPAYPSTYVGQTAAPAYSPSYGGQAAAPAYSSTYVGQSAAPAF